MKSDIVQDCVPQTLHYTAAFAPDSIERHPARFYFHACALCQITLLASFTSLTSAVNLVPSKRGRITEVT